MLLNEDAKRLLIFFFYDKDVIVDRYISYMLDDMKKNVNDIIFVSNGKINDKSKPIVEKITKNILERKNEGLDVWAYKEALENIGWENLKLYDEVILMNHTIMGPVYPFKEMFDKMSQKDLDFWGLTKFHEVPYDPFGIIECGYIPEHIQSHFIVVRKSILNSIEFQKYWEDLPEINSYEESIAFHETQFTKHFEELGFSWEVYVDTDDLKDYCCCPIMYNIVNLIKNKRCPVFKRRSFFTNYDDILNNTAGEISYELMEYLKKHTNYDVDLIWENILRCYNMAQIKDCLQLNYVLPVDETEESKNANILKNRKVALIFHAYFKDLADSTYHYVNSMPKEADVYITTDTEEKKNFFEKLFKDHKFNKLEVILIENRGRDVSALLVASKDFVMDYDYVCFAHDKKVGQLEFLSVGASFAYQCLENTLKSEGYVKNIITLFENNPRLGIIMPPPPFHSVWFNKIADAWGPNYQGVQLLCDQLELNVPISKNISPIAPLGSTFWFRTKGMKKLFNYNWKYEDFPKEPLKSDGAVSHAIERIHGLVQQDAGYYAAWCLNEKFAPIMITNLNYMLSGIVSGLIKNDVKANYIDTKKIVEEQCGLVNNLKAANYHINNLLPKVLTNDEKRGLMRVYYDNGEGFSEKNSVCSKVSKGEKFSIVLRIPKNINSIKRLRFDPEENRNIILKNLNITIEYSDGNKSEVSILNCLTNGIYHKDKILFFNEDPQIVWNENNKDIKRIYISSEIFRNAKFSKMLKLKMKALEHFKKFFRKLLRKG